MWWAVGRVVQGLLSDPGFELRLARKKLKGKKSAKIGNPSRDEQQNTKKIHTMTNSYDRLLLEERMARGFLQHRSTGSPTKH